MPKKRILLILHRIPFPVIGGDNITNSNIIKILNKRYDLDVVIITYERYHPNSEEFLKLHTNSYKIFHLSKWRFMLNGLKTFINLRPFQINLFYTKEVQKFIDANILKYDILFAGIVRTAKYVSKFNIPKILFMGDSLGLNYKYSHRKTCSWFWKIYYLCEYPLILKYEKKMIDNFDITIMFNKREIDYFNSSKIIQIPQAVNEQLFEYEKVDTKYKNFISYFGKMNYRPNVDAVLWFVEQVLPHIPKELNFQIIGANPVKELIDLAKDNPRVFVRGYVEDPYLLLKSSLCIVAPMQTGGGIQNKILESMALATIVITTPYAAFPIAREEDNVLLIANEAREWIEKINQLYMYPEKFNHIKENARNYIKNNFTLEKFEKTLLKAINNLVT